MSVRRFSITIVVDPSLPALFEHLGKEKVKTPAQLSAELDTLRRGHTSVNCSQQQSQPKRRNGAGSSQTSSGGDSLGGSDSNEGNSRLHEFSGLDDDNG